MSHVIRDSNGAEVGYGRWFTWNNTPKVTEARNTAGRGPFFDETLRDGLQAPNVRNPTSAQKLALVDHAVAAGVGAADLGFPGAGGGALKECIEIARHIDANGYKLAQGYAGRTHVADVGAICEVAQAAGVSVDAYIFIGISPIRQYVEDWDFGSIRRNIQDSARMCSQEGVNFVLVLEDTVRCPPQLLRQIYDVAIDVGVRRMCLCDTVGAALPSGTETLVRWSIRYFADRGHPVDFEWHGHNDRGLALANSLTALSAGCVLVHGTILGIGERTGNASLDQLIVNSHLDEGAAYDLIALRKYCEFASEVLGTAIPHNYPAMGSDVFTTSAGVHAAAILKAHTKGDVLAKDAVYSSVPASLFGRTQEVIIDASSGASNVRYWLATNGVGDDPVLVGKILRHAKGSNTPLTDDLIRQIIAATD
ncbi:LeuA family protein [Nocardia sp. NPDC049149]|uniref:LeuA family protein n=1 Tax=Nocardia sp. NPDC049149 TaxID=3364315 RepID=UPI0037176F47